MVYPDRPRISKKIHIKYEFFPGRNVVDLSNRCSLAATLNVLSLTDIAEDKVTINDDNRKWWAPIKYRGTLHKFSISEDSDNDATSMTLTSVSTTLRITIIEMYELRTDRKIGGPGHDFFGGGYFRIPKR